MSYCTKWIYRFIIVCVLLSCSTQKVKTTIQIPHGLVGLVGYGSLMSRQSMESTLKRAYQDSIYLVHLKDFIREWSYICSNYDTSDPRTELSKYDGYSIKGMDTLYIEKLIYMNIMPKANSKINCVLYFFSPEEITGFDKREFGYERIDITNMIEEYDFTGGNVYTFRATPEYTYNPDLDQKGNIIDKAYVEKITTACDSIGLDFRKEFEETTLPYNPDFVAPVIWKKVR